MNREERRKAIRRRRIFIALCALLLAVLITLISILGIKIFDAISGDDSNETKPSTSQSENEDKTPKKIASATVINTGDILVHNAVLDGAKTSSGEYDFTPFFTEADDYFKKADLAVINLEVTLGGTQAGSYKGYPAFNTPDSLVDAIKSAGIDICLTANNHSYDTGMYGMVRTVQVLKEKQMGYIGTRETADEPAFIVKDVNGIKMGMACYTYENTSSGRKSLNGNVLKAEAEPLVNSFDYNHIDTFYAEAEAVISEMKKNNADCIIFYMHWGNEYKLSPNTWQKSIAQKLCNLGVDVIVGGHPHVLQPMEMIYAEGSEHKTVCLYSTGNSISNQRIEEMTGVITSGHTEDGVLFSFTFDKYSDGTTVLSAVDAIPTWVNKVGSRYKAKYTMYPLENASFGTDKYGMDSATAQKMQKSFERTKALLAESLTACQTALGCNVRFAD